MKKTKLLLAASLLSIGAFTTTVMTSCSKDDKTCNLGYEGSDCKTLSRDKFIGQWKGHEACTLGTDDYTITISPSSTGDLNLVYTNVYNQSFVASGTITGPYGFSFSGTGAVTGGTATFSGNVSLDPSTGVLTSTYNIESPASSNACTFTGTKL
jgi:hypothetical protein